MQQRLFELDWSTLRRRSPGSLSLNSHAWLTKQVLALLALAFFLATSFRAGWLPLRSYANASRCASITIGAGLRGK